MLKLLIGKDWTVNRREIFNRIAQDVHNKLGNRILLVPELISHQCERLLCEAAGDTASRYAEVLSFTRLVQRVSDYAGTAVYPCLDNGGRIVAMASVSRQLSSRLKAYAAMETKPEFLEGLMDAVDEFKRCCITPADLLNASKSMDGSFAQKLEELSLIMECYDALCVRGKRDPRDQMSWLLEQMEDCSFAEEHVFYIDGFPDFTRQNLEIIAHLIKTAPCVTISLNCDEIASDWLSFEKAGQTAQEIIRIAQKTGVDISIEKLPEREDSLKPVRDKLFQGKISPDSVCPVLKTMRAESPVSECMAVLQEILQLVESGCRYRDIAVVCADLDTYKPLMNMVFHRYQIPVYCAGTESILQKSVISTVLNGLDAALSGFDPKIMVRYLRAALSPLDPDDCDVLENYVILWGIRGQKWLLNWENHPEGLGLSWEQHHHRLLEKLNQDRITVVQPLENLRQGFQKARNVRDQVLSITTFLDEIHMDQRLAVLAQELDSSNDNQSAQVLNQLWEILLTALEQLYDVLGDTLWDSDHFTRLFRLLLSQYDVGTIPPVLDAVQMGAVSAMRCNQQKHLFLVGAEEGKLPGYSGSAGVLTDQERTALRQLGVPLTGGAMEGIQAEFAEIFGVFCGATDSVHLLCSGEHPSFIFKRMEQLCGHIAVYQDSVGFSMADPLDAAAYLVRWNAEQTARAIGLIEQYQNIAQRSGYDLGTVSIENIQGLYGKSLNLSASQIDRAAECRLSYFLKYGLRAKERKEITVDPAEFGTYVHAVLENTTKCVREMGGFHQVTLEETLEIAHRYSEEYAAERFSQIESERMVYLFRRNIQELDMVVQELWKELKDAAFEPVGFEVGFGDSDGLPPISIPNRSMNAILRGFIDRVDLWKSAGSSYYRVVDYKTGKKDFDYCDIYNGVGLQMLLYMFALRSSGYSELGEKPVAAGVQYFPARVPYLPADGMLDDDAAEKSRNSQWKRKGLLLEDESVLQAMEPGDQPTRLCYSIKKDGSYSGDLADRDQLKLLEKYIFHILSRLVEDIACGNVKANPYSRGTSHNACWFCPYGSICHPNTVNGRRNYKAMSSQRFWEEVGKEMQKHG